MGDYNGILTDLQHYSDAAQVLARLDRPPVAGLYLHVPFCFHKCHYCDFYSIVDDRDRQAAFTSRMISELAALAPLVEHRIETIFVGGGTPTLLQPALWDRLLVALTEHFDLTALREFTVEANPETVTAGLLQRLAAGGVNRLSIGCQSFDPVHLKTLERWHDPANVERAFTLAHAAGITNVNLDLIFAIPGQTMAEWQADLARALKLGPTHLSCYSLMYEPNTALTKKLQLGLLDRCDTDLESAMYEWTIDHLAAAGFEHYEISNWARRANAPASTDARVPDNRCAHNLLYWLNGDWLPVGPSGSGHVAGVRWKNVPHLGRYLAGSGTAPVQEVEQLDPEASAGEQIMLRLRLIEGIERAWLEPHLTDERRQAIAEHLAKGLLLQTDTHLHLTRRGLLLADDVAADLL